MTAGPKEPVKRLIRVVAWSVIVAVGLFAAYLVSLGLPTPAHVASLRLIPSPLRKQYVNFVLGPEHGFLRTGGDKLQIIMALEEAQSDGDPLVSDYRAVIPYTGGHNRAMGAPDAEADDFPDADNLIFESRDVALAEATFAFHAGSTEGIHTLCSAMYRTHSEEAFRGLSEKHCTAFDYRGFYANPA
jgi:hypothetical protein